MVRTVRIGLAQIEPGQGDVEGNAERILRHVKLARREKVDLLLTPELALIGYGCGDIFLDKVEENEEALERITEKVRGFYAIIGHVEEDADGFLYNAAALVKDGRVLGRYRKADLANYRLFDEWRYFKPGDKCPVFETDFGRIGITICEDLWHPEPARAMAFRGALLIACISASPYDWGKEGLWDAFLRERVHDNLVFMAFANQAGCQDGATYWGGSKILSPTGEVLAEAKLVSEDFVTADLDLGEVARVRRRDLRLRDVRRPILEELLGAYEEREDAGPQR